MNNFIEDIKDFTTAEQRQDFEKAYYNNVFIARCISIYEDESGIEYENIKKILLENKSLMGLLGTEKINTISILITIVNLLYNQVEQFQLKEIQRISDNVE